MKVSKEIAKKAAEYEEAKKKADKLYEELEAWSNENGFEDFYINDFGIVEEPEGEEQKEGEYCDQWRHGEDWYTGTYYYPIEGSDKYVAYTYES